MKNVILVTIGTMLLTPSLFANTLCAVQRESTPDQYDKQIVMKSFENKNAEVLLFEDGDVKVYVNVGAGENHDEMAILITKPAAKTYSAIGFGSGKTLSVIDGVNRLSVGCGRVQ